MAVDTEEIENNDSGSPNPTAGLLGGGSQSYNPELSSALSEIKATGKENPVTVDDFKSDNGRPATGALSNETYYPGMNLPTRVGNYSGSMVGSIDLFAPTGNLVPIGMSDARDLAVKKAAMQKQLENEKFLKDHQRPITKDTQIQPQLTKQYNDYIATNLASAKKKYGKNAVAFLNQDPDFQNGLNELQDTAKHYDALIDHDLKLDQAEKDPNFVVSPELRQSRADLHNKIIAIGNNPSSPEAKGLVNTFLNSKATYDLDTVANDYLKSVKPDINEADLAESLKAGKKVGTEQFLDQLKKTSYSPERMEPGMQNVYRARYAGDPMAPSYEQFRQSVLSKVNEHVEHQFKNFDTYHAPVQGKDEDYSQATPQTKTNINQDVPEGNTAYNMPGIHPIHVEDAFNLTDKDRSKELDFTLGQNVVSIKGEPLNNKSGYVKGRVQQVGNFPYYTSEKRYLTPKEAENLHKIGGIYHNSGIEWRPGAVVNITPKTDEKGEVEDSKTAIFPLGDIKGTFGKSFEDNVIKKVEANASNKNVSKQAQQSSGSESKMITVSLDGRTGQIPESQWEAFLKKHTTATR